MHIQRKYTVEIVANQSQINMTMPCSNSCQKEFDFLSQRKIEGIHHVGSLGFG